MNEVTRFDPPSALTKDERARLITLWGMEGTPEFNSAHRAEMAALVGKMTTPKFKTPDFPDADEIANLSASQVVQMADGWDPENL